MPATIAPHPSRPVCPADPGRPGSQLSSAHPGAHTRPFPA